MFTIDQDGHIILDDGTTLYTYDLKGNLCSKREDEHSEESMRLERLREITAGDGYVYHLESFLGYRTIYRDVGLTPTVVYRTPIFDYLVLLTLTLCGLTLGALLLTLFYGRFRAARELAEPIPDGEGDAPQDEAEPGSTPPV